MIKQFLYEYEQELLETRIDLSKEIHKIEMSLQENQSMLDFIEVSEEKSHDSFSPLDYESDINNQKIRELRIEEKNLKEEKDILEIKLSKIISRLSELHAVIQEINEYQIHMSKQDNPAENKNDIPAVISELTDKEKEKSICCHISDASQSMSNIMHKIQLCIGLVDLDANRCRIELHNSINIIQGEVDKMNKFVNEMKNNQSKYSDSEDSEV